MEIPTEKVEIEYNGEKHEVLVKEITWGDQNQCAREAVKKVLRPDGSVDQELDNVKVRELSIWKALHKHPFEKFEDLLNVPKSVGNIISFAYFRMNEVSDAEGSDAAQDNMGQTESK